MSNTFAAFVSIGFHGLAFAMVLYLISVGLSVTMGMMGFVNLAHGVFAMLGGYVLTSLMSRMGVPFGLALIAAFLATALGSLILERLLYRRLYGGDELDQVLLTMGLIFMSVAAATYVWGPLQQPMHPPRWLSGQLDFGFRSFPGYRSFLILCGAGLVIGLWLGLERTRFGMKVRAAVDNLRTAPSLSLVGGAALGGDHCRLCLVSELSAARRPDPCDNPVRAVGRPRARLRRHRDLGARRVFWHRRLHRRHPCCPWLGRADHRPPGGHGRGGPDRLCVGLDRFAHDRSDVADADPCRRDTAL